MPLKPKLIATPEMGYYQIGESWAFSVRLEDPELNQEVVATSATLTVTHAGGGALTSPIAGAAMTVAGAALTYTVGASAIANPERCCRAVLTVVVDGATWQYLHLFDAVRFSPVCPVSVSELATMLPEIGVLLTQADPQGAQLLREAWADILGWLKSLDVYPDLVLDRSELVRGTLLHARELIWQRAIGQKDDSAHVQHELWAKRCKEWRESARLTIDANETGTLDPEERPQSLSVVRFGRRNTSSSTY